MRLGVEQEIRLVCGGHVYRETITLATKTEGGIPARHPDMVHKHIEVNLGSIRNPPINERLTKKGANKPYGPEDKFMLEQI